MAHNPPRVWITGQQLRNVEASARRKRQEWHSVEDLAERMQARADAGRRVVLSPGTADFLAKWIKGKVEG